MSVIKVRLNEHAKKIILRQMELEDCNDFYCRHCLYCMLKEILDKDDEKIKEIMNSSFMYDIENEEIYHASSPENYRSEIDKDIGDLITNHTICKL